MELSVLIPRATGTETSVTGDGPAVLDSRGVHRTIRGIRGALVIIKGSFGHKHIEGALDLRGDLALVFWGWGRGGEGRRRKSLLPEVKGEVRTTHCGRHEHMQNCTHNDMLACASTEEQRATRTDESSSTWPHQIAEGRQHRALAASLGPHIGCM